MTERDPLRYELADHDVQVGDDQEGQDHCEHRGHYRVELVREQLLAEGADPEARHRDPELHRGDEPRRVARDPEDVAGPTVALVLELEDARSTRGDQAVFGPDEERVRDD